MPKYIRTIKQGRKKIEVDVSLERDFVCADGNRHPRQVLWEWTEKDLWDVLQIKIIKD